MLTDVVIDTDVLMHADDPRQLFQADLAETLRRVLVSRIQLCVDEGFAALPVENRSRIGSEYFSRLVPNSLGYQFVATMAASGRLSLLPPRAAAAAQRKIEALIQNTRDRTFLAVAHNSQDRLLCSHDEQDYPEDVRDEIEESLGVIVCDDTGLRSRI